MKCKSIAINVVPAKSLTSGWHRVHPLFSSGAVKQDRSWLDRRKNHFSVRTAKHSTRLQRSPLAARFPGPGWAKPSVWSQLMLLGAGGTTLGLETSWHHFLPKLSYDFMLNVIKIGMLEMTHILNSCIQQIKVMPKYERWNGKTKRIEIQTILK